MITWKGQPQQEEKNVVTDRDRWKYKYIKLRTRQMISIYTKTLLATRY